MSEQKELDICKEYREAKNKSEQIEILAQLNCCDVEEIKEILKKHGYEVPECKKRGPKAGTKKAKPVTAKKVSIKDIPAREIPLNKPEKQTEEVRELETVFIIPESVRIVLINEMEAIDAEVKRLSKQYAEIATFLCGTANG